MQIFSCCCPDSPPLFFENRSCAICQRSVGYVDATLAIHPLDASDGDSFTIGTTGTGLSPSEKDKSVYRRCENGVAFDACNGYVKQGLLDAESKQETLCYACHFNNVIPNLDVEAHQALWRDLETAKRRALFTLVQLKLPIPDRIALPDNGLTFNFAADKNAHDHFQSKLPGVNPIFTGHDNGIITINLAEADNVARTQAMSNLGEQYRTLLGHFRHEIGHFYWDILVSNAPTWLEKFRALFGDDRTDYQAAMDNHYKHGAPDNWLDTHISAYATMHPWEDWAETWAHYLHMMDSLDTAVSHGLIQTDTASGIEHVMDAPIDNCLNTWMALTIKLNALNRSMGLPDAYPFVLSQPVCEKLRLIHQIVKHAPADTQLIA